MALKEQQGWTQPILWHVPTAGTSLIMRCQTLYSVEPTEAFVIEEELGAVVGQSFAVIGLKRDKRDFSIRGPVSPGKKDLSGR